MQGKRAPYPPAELRVRREHEHRALLLALLHEDGRALGRLYGWAGVQVKRCMGALMAMERAPASEEEAPAEEPAGWTIINHQNRAKTATQTGSLLSRRRVRACTEGMHSADTN